MPASLFVNVSIWTVDQILVIKSSCDEVGLGFETVQTKYGPDQQGLALCGTAQSVWLVSGR